MGQSRFYYAPPKVKNGEGIHVSSLGIHEVMQPGIISHGGHGCPYLLIFFHSPAYISPDSSDEVMAEHGIIIWDRGRFHEYGNDVERWDHSWLVIDGAMAGRVLRLHRFPLNKPVFADVEKTFIHYLYLMHEELSGFEKPEAYVVERLFELMVHGLARSLNKDNSNIPENIVSVRDYICRSISEPLTLAQLASMSCLSIPRFSVLFKIHYGLSPINYLHQQRMGCAAELLRFQNLSVKEVAARVGFQDQLYFSRQFRNTYGVSPSSYRA